MVMLRCLCMIKEISELSRQVCCLVGFFSHTNRNLNQAMILRDQKSWSGRSATERLFWTTDNSIELASRSTDWVARE